MSAECDDCGNHSAECECMKYKVLSIFMDASDCIIDPDLDEQSFEFCEAVIFAAMRYFKDKRDDHI